MKTTVGKWWWDDGHIAAHFNDPDESPDGLTYRPECAKCVELMRLAVPMIYKPEGK